MSKEILDGHQIRIGIEKLCGHRVPEMVTGDLQTTFPGIVFYSFLYPSNGDRLTGEWCFLSQEQFLCPAFRPYPEILKQWIKGIIADVNDPAFSSFALCYNDLPLFQIQSPKKSERKDRSIWMRTFRSYLVSL